jgi:4-hydroxy-tetrahydrodipicolinate reductase
MMTGIWGGPLYMIAQAVGVKIERTQENYTRWTGDRAVDFAQGRVLPGEAAAHRIELQGIVDGEPRIIIDHIHRLYPDAAPEWPRPRIDETHANRVEIIGRPNILQETVLSDADTGDGNGGGCLATGMRVFNAIPAVCAAAPGILSALDLPVIPGRGVIRADSLKGTPA